jgi:hypothetical protein
MLKTTIYPDADSLAEKDGAEFETDFVSLVNHDTYGPPALVAPNPREPRPTARPGQTVLYINTSVVAAFKIYRPSSDQ